MRKMGFRARITQMILVFYLLYFGGCHFAFVTLIRSFISICNLWGEVGLDTLSKVGLFNRDVRWGSRLGFDFGHCRKSLA